MEITKGENANLAGMEPRCPKCDGTELTFKSGSDLVGWMGKIWCASCTGEWAYYDIEDWKDFAQFFRSPAPTPPLDVEAEKRITEIRERESKATKGPWKKYHRVSPRGAHQQWHIGNHDGACQITMGGREIDFDFIAHSRQDIPFLLEQRDFLLEQLSLLRRHIASPAPQLKLKIQELVGLPVDREIEDDLVFSAVKALHHAVGLCQHSHWGVSVTHWPPLPAPPQSGKEGQ